MYSKLINPFFYLLFHRKKGLKIGCGVFGAINFEKKPVFPYVYWGLRAQNHRGHQSHGFLTFTDGRFYVYKNLDLVPKLQSSSIQEWCGRLPGSGGIGNVRYTTSGKCDNFSLLKGTQPVTALLNGLRLAISFNGNIVNTLQLRKETDCQFADLSYTCDSDLVCRKLLLELEKRKDLTSAVSECMRNIDGFQRSARHKTTMRRI
jgi:glutamine phosphoribosylpyrophosphate amidotransferase